jgi:hypothetical protein
MNILSGIILIVIAVWLILAFVYLAKHKGGSCAGGCTGCSGCAGCAQAGNCSKYKDVDVQSTSKHDKKQA